MSENGTEEYMNDSFEEDDGLQWETIEDTEDESVYDEEGPGEDREETVPKKSPEDVPLPVLIRDLLIKIALIALAIVLLTTFVMTIRVAHDNSMYPAVRDGDLGFFYKPGTYEQEDIVIYEANDKIRMGRVIGLPGQTIELSEDGLMRNGSPVSEKIFYPTSAEGSLVTYPYEVPADAYFVLNDFRTDTGDSRSYGAVSKKNIRGRLVFLLRRRGF